MKPTRLIQIMILLLSLFEIFTLVAKVHAQSPEATFTLYLPASLKDGETAPPSSPPPADTNLPAELVTTWYTGVIPPTDYYNPVTGEWRATNGLGEMYQFSANGNFVYAGFLRIQNGQCLTEVSAYREGNAKAAEAQLTLTPNLAKTRTVVRCGSNSDTTSDGPFNTTTIAYQVAEKPEGLIQLTLTDKGTSTSYHRQGMVESLAGSWQRGAVKSTNFYDPATQSFAPQSGEGGWYRFDSDGTYTFGEFGYGSDAQGCTLSAWVYQQGTVSISGGRLTTTPVTGVARVDNACRPSAPDVKPYVEAERAFTWFYRDRNSEPKLVLIPLEAFQEFIYMPE